MFYFIKFSNLNNKHDIMMFIITMFQNIFISTYLLVYFSFQLFLSIINEMVSYATHQNI